jgi:hypothetical protein
MEFIGKQGERRFVLIPLNFYLRRTSLIRLNDVVEIIPCRAPTVPIESATLRPSSSPD